MIFLKLNNGLVNATYIINLFIHKPMCKGKRNTLIRDAHTRLLHGELIPVEITAACFDPGYQLLLTGARNGSLKVS